MRQSTLSAALAALVAVGLWHLPATAQRAAAATPTTPAAAPRAPAATPKPAPHPITFAEYRDFRLNYIAGRRASLARRLAAPGLSADEKTRLEGIKAYYDRQAAMPAAERDKLFRERFDQIDTNRDGKLDDAERAVWRQKQQQYYAGLAAQRAAARPDQP